DGQTEHFNSVTGQYICCYVNYLQDDWAKWLELAEFSGNNHSLETTGISSFFANYGYDPICHIDSVQAPHNGPFKEQYNVSEISRKIKEITDHLQLEMNRAQLRHTEAANQKQTLAPRYQ